MKRGFAAEYLTSDAIVAAIRAVRARGATDLEAFTPVPSAAIDAALGARRSPLSVAAGLGGLAGAIGGYALQWLLVAYLYPADVGGRPPHMPLAFTIITIEMGFLFGALAAVVAFAIACRLGRLWQPIFEVPGFESATRAGYWLAVGSADPQLETVLVETQPAQLHRFGGVP